MNPEPPNNLTQSIEGPSVESQSPAVTGAVSAEDAPHASPATASTQPALIDSRPFWRVFDYLLAGAWLTMTAFGVWVVAGELYYQLESPSWTTMWESGPLQIARNTYHGRSIYTNWESGPVHLAIYGPLYHAVLGLLAWLTGAESDALTAAARWLSILSLGAAALGIVRYVRIAGAPVAAALIAPACLLLLTRTGLRFLASARPDGMAAMFSVLALIAGFGRGRASAAITIVLLTAAWQTKMSSIAAFITIIVILLHAGRYSRAAWIAGGTCALNYAALVLIDMATAGEASRHLFAPSAAPMRLEYLKFMLTCQPSPELPLLVVLPLLAILVSLRCGLPQLEDSTRSRGAVVYLLVCWAVALSTGLHQGSDRNYLIEPTLATGMVLGVFAGRLNLTRFARDGSHLWISRTVAGAALACCAVMLLPYRTSRFSDDARVGREMRNIYSQATSTWARQLPQPLLSLDSWLTYRAGVANDLNDSIAYVGLLNKARVDVVAQRAAAREYATVIVFNDIEDRGRVWGDIPWIWPALQQSVAANYVLKEKHRPWAVYSRIGGPATQNSR